MTATQHRAYSAPMLTETAKLAPTPATDEASCLGEWRALWALEYGQPTWVSSAVAAMDGAIQGLMGHS